MQLRAWFLVGAMGGVIGLAASSAPVQAGEAPTAKLALSFKPVQKDVDYEQPSAGDAEKCEVKVERSGKASGWVVLGPSGQVLRRFVDTNGDNVVDQWRYYKHGLEVYRDVDSNFNNKVDQSRWLNTAGSRWGIDENEDGRIDRWKVLSAEEASREAVRALTAGDNQALQRLMVAKDDLDQLGIEGDVAKKLLDSVADAGRKMQDVLSKSKALTPQARWLRFDTSMPSIIPAEDGKASSDLTIYENAMAIMDTGGKTVLLQIGEMIKVGDVWKLTQVPQPLEGNTVQVTVGGILMQPALPLADGAAPGMTGVSPEMQKLLEQLQKLDQNSPSPTETAALARYNRQRADLLADVVAKARSPEEKAQWTRQMVDGIAASVQTGAYPDGLKRLKDVLDDAKKAKADESLVAYITFRTMLAQYSLDMQTSDNAKRQEVQQWWLKELESFVEDFPTAADTPEALLQLAVTYEFGGKIDDAKKWYTALVDDHSKTTAGARAAGAIKRLDLKDKSFTLSGPGLKGGAVDARSYRDKVLLVLFWSTWCKPCTEDLPQLRALYQQYRGEGFEIVGVNLDSTAEPVQPYLAEHRVTWPQIHQAGGLESEPAIAYGIISLPTMFLVDKGGTVLSRNISVDDLKTTLPELLKKK